jgi:hypothetical protein
VVGGECVQEKRRLALLSTKRLRVHHKLIMSKELLEETGRDDRINVRNGACNDSLLFLSISISGAERCDKMR